MSDTKNHILIPDGQYTAVIDTCDYISTCIPYVSIIFRIQGGDYDGRLLERLYPEGMAGLKGFICKITIVNEELDTGLKVCRISSTEIVPSYKR